MFEIVNNTDKKLEEMDFFKKYVKYVCQKMEIEKAVFDIVFVTNDEIKRINREYRSVDNITDVISFALEDSGGYQNSEIRVLGDIYIALDVAYEQAFMYGHSDIREICFLITHGILHLLGYDHMEEDEEKIMFDKQKELLENYEIFR